MARWTPNALRVLAGGVGPRWDRNGPTRNRGGASSTRSSPTPGPSGFLHVGHLRAYAVRRRPPPVPSDAGRAGPSAVRSPRLRSPGRPWAQQGPGPRPRRRSIQLEEARVPASDWPRLEDPEAAARFLGGTYAQSCARSASWSTRRPTLRRSTTTIARSFAGSSARSRRTVPSSREPTIASVCPVCGPVAVDPSETDLSSGGDAEVLRCTPRCRSAWTTVGSSLRRPLRPETVYGVTNLWVAQGEYAGRLAPRRAVVPGRLRHGAERLVEQHGGRIGHRSRPQTCSATR